MEETKLEGTAEERAKKVGEAIRCTLKAKGVKLQRKRYQVCDVVGEVCEACALGTLALSFGYKVRYHSDSVEAILAKGGQWLTRSEADQLELGFEGNTSSYDLGWGDINGNWVTADESSPFWQLGHELAKERR